MRITKYKTKLAENGKAILTKELSVNYPNIKRVMSTPERVDRLAREFLELHEAAEEYVYMLCMNNKNVLTSIIEISHGTVNSSLVNPREVFQKALLANAVAIILLHNHPSGDPYPSQEDIKITKRLIEAGGVVGVELLDHLIIGRSYYSLKAEGLI